MKAIFRVELTSRLDLFETKIAFGDNGFINWGSEKVRVFHSMRPNTELEYLYCGEVYGWSGRQIHCVGCTKKFSIKELTQDYLVATRKLDKLTDKFGISKWNPR